MGGFTSVWDGLETAHLPSVQKVVLGDAQGPFQCCNSEIQRTALLMTIRTFPNVAS